MDSSGVRAALQQEAQRRGMMGGQSNVGTQANVSASQPMPQGQGTPPLAESMYQGATGMMQKAEPNETSIILKALIKRLHQNPVQGAPQNPTGQ